MVAFSALMNAAYDALATNSSGASSPANGPGSAPLEFQSWFDTTDVNLPVFRFFDGVSWDRIGTLDVVNSNWLPQLGGGVATLPSASTTNIGAQPQTFITVSGTTTINSFGSAAKTGEMKLVNSSGTFTIANSASILCPNGVNLSIAVGDAFFAVYKGGGVWAIVEYVPANSSPQVPYSGGVWTNGSPVATVSRLDRLLVGTSAVNSGDSPTTTKDWLETLIANTTTFAQLAGITPKSGIGTLGGARTSDTASGSNAIGVGGFVNNDSGGVNQRGYALYGEAWHNNATARFTTALELDIVNKITPVVTIDPWNVDPGSQTAALWLASGGSRAGVHPASAAHVILANGTTFDKGIVIQEGALTSSTGIALALPTGYQIGWYVSAGVLGSTIQATINGIALSKVLTAGNGTVGPMTMGSAGPAGANAGVQEWMVVTSNAGVTRYIPLF